LSVLVAWGPFILWSGGLAQTGAPDVSAPCDGGGGGWCEGTIVCQQWFWYENGEIVDEWWECWCEAAQ
jgi:hypothetical protein